MLLIHLLKPPEVDNLAHYIRRRAASHVLRALQTSSARGGRGAGIVRAASRKLAPKDHSCCSFSWLCRSSGRECEEDIVEGAPGVLSWERGDYWGGRIRVACEVSSGARRRIWHGLKHGGARGAEGAGEGCDTGSSGNGSLTRCRCGKETPRIDESPILGSAMLQ